MNQKQQLNAYIQHIEEPHFEIYNKMEQYIDGLTKPVGALGKMEHLVCQLAAIQNTMQVCTTPKVTVIMCGDNGVYEEGISSCPQEVTETVTYNFTRGITAMNKLSAFAKSDIHIVDIGVKQPVQHPKVISRRIKAGTANMLKTPAMTYEEALQAINVGIEETEVLIEKGYQIFGTGEMGIGNTTTSAAITAVLLGLQVEQVTGRGSGALEPLYQQKLEVIKEAIKIHRPQPQDPVDVLAKVGGLDIAGLVGVYLAAAKHKKMVVIDGFIAATAALVAYQLCPKTKNYMVASHLSKEDGMAHILEHIGIEAHVYLNMRLGEGSGCPVLFQILDMAVYTLLGMGTFEEAGVDATKYQSLWK